MKPSTTEWVDKAEADFAAAMVLRKSRKRFSRDIVCFHLQQCVEKYLKARLVEAGIAFPRIHDLEKLLNLALPVEPLWVTLRTAVVTLTAYAVEVRYPGKSTTSAEAKILVRDTTHIREMVRTALGLPAK